MKFTTVLKCTGAVFAGLFLQSQVFAEDADLSALEKLAPSAKGYTLIAKFNPLNYKSKGYIVDQVDALQGKLIRLGYYLRITGKNGKVSSVYAEMDPFTQNLAKTVVPEGKSQLTQDYVKNLFVASDVPGVATGKFEKGNVEIWAANYGGGNAKNIPGATGAFDFGDGYDANAAIGYGSFQVHNYLKKQTVFAFNNFNAQANCDLGIGSNPKGHPDWTFSKNGANCKDAVILVVGKFENLKKIEIVKVDPAKIKSFKVISSKCFYKPGEEMVFTVKSDLGNQKPTKPCKFFWTRTGDDGKRETSSGEIVPGKDYQFKTKLSVPGFVRIQGYLADSKGRKLGNFTFDGGAGVEPEKLTGSPEPKDFDAFWAKQKAKLAKVPMKADVKKIAVKDGVNIYAVSVTCAGPRPVTGYLTIPANAKEKSLAATVQYQGYSTNIQGVPGRWLNKSNIIFEINAHGYDLVGKDKKYYDEFVSKLKSNGHGYAFDPKQNSDPEKAYFNGMVLRVLRSLEFVKSLKEYDGKRLSVFGGSQGGLQSIWAAALDHDVRSCHAFIPWCCDLSGPNKHKRLGGWRPSYVPALDYYDAANHAKRIPKSCTVNISRAGLGDYVCPPSGVTILYNNITAPKSIDYYQGSTHGFVPKNPQTFKFSAKAK